MIDRGTASALVEPVRSSRVDRDVVRRAAGTELPIQLRRTETLAIIARTESEAADGLMPAPLELNGDLCVGASCVCTTPSGSASIASRRGRFRCACRVVSPRSLAYIMLERRRRRRRRARGLRPAQEGRAGIAPTERRPAGRPRCPQRHRDRHSDDDLEAAAARGTELEQLVAGSGVNVDLRCARRKARRSAAHWSPRISRMWSSMRRGRAWSLGLRADAQAPVICCPCARSCSRSTAWST